MLRTVAVEVAHRRVPADQDTTARPMAGRFHRCHETLVVEVHEPSLHRDGETTTDLPRPAPHHDSDRWSE